MKYLHEDATVRDYPASKPFPMEVLVPETATERALMFSLLCSSMNRSPSDTPQFSVDEKGVWDAEDIGSIVVWRKGPGGTEDYPDGTVFATLIERVVVNGAHCVSLQDLPCFGDDGEFEDQCESDAIKKDPFDGLAQADIDFREMTNLQRYNLMDASLRTLSAEFGMDRGAYKKWEAQVVEMCRQKKISLMEFVAKAGISNWFRRFVSGQTPESVWEEFAQEPTGSLAFDPCDTSTWSKAQREAMKLRFPGCCRDSIETLPVVAGEYGVWISFLEAFPDDEDDYLLTDGKIVCFALFAFDGIYFPEINDDHNEFINSVTHWMRLPDPPGRATVS